MNNSPRIASVLVLDDDPFLHVFYHYRPFLLDEDENENTCLLGALAAAKVQLLFQRTM